MTTTLSSKRQAEKIVAELAQDPGRAPGVETGRLHQFFVEHIAEVDRDQVTARVAQLRARHSDANPDELVEQLVKAKCQKSAAVGAVSASGALLPGIGTFIAGTAGLVADLRTVIKLQAELVLEIGEVYGAPLEDEHRQRVVMLLTGVGYGTGPLLAATATKLTGKVAARVARNWLTHALPIIGVATSASTNALSTYIVGQRAKAYFSYGPDAVGDWGDTLRLISGVDERKVARWLAERGVEAQQSVSAAAASAGATLAAVKAATGRSAAQTGDRFVESVRSASKKIGRASTRASATVRRVGRASRRGIGRVLGPAAKTVKSAAKKSARKRRT